MMMIVIIMWMVMLMMMMISEMFNISLLIYMKVDFLPSVLYRVSI